MPLNPNTYYNNSRETIKIIEQLEIDGLEILTRQMKIKTDIENPETWRTRKLVNLNSTTQKYRKIIEVTETDEAVATGLLKNIRLGITETDNDMTAVSEDSAVLNKKISAVNVVDPREFVRTPPLRLSTAIKQVQDNINGIRRNMLTGFNSIYLDTVNRATLLQQSGVLTMDQAIQRVLNEWADSGIPVLIDRGGKRWSANAYAENIMRRSSLDAYRVSQEERQKEYGFGLVSISVHSDCSPLCRPWQGGIYNLEDNPSPDSRFKDLSEAVDGGLYHNNCKHYQSTYFPNISKVQKPIDNKEIDKNWSNNERQRQIERNIKKWKNRKAVAISPTDQEKSNKKIKEWQGEMRTFINDTGRTRQRRREQI